MSELKTLNDLNNEWIEQKESNYRPYYVEEVRKEAIKWIKYVKEGNFTTSYREICGIIAWIESFFNITEEDIK